MPEVRYVGPWQTGHLYYKGDVVSRNGTKYQATINVETNSDPAVVGAEWIPAEPLTLLVISLNGDGSVNGGGTPTLPALDALGVATDAELAAHAAASDPHPTYATDADLANHGADATGVHGIANAANLVLTNDARLADARTPLSHGHTIGDSANLQSSLDAKSATTHNHDASYAAVGHTHAGTSIPAGLIAMWGGLIADIPAGWLLCDGQNGTPDLRSRFIKGAAAGQEAGGTGGATTHGHTVTQPSAHPLLSHSAHSGTTVGNHAFTQPGAHTDHAALAHTAHSGATVGNHTDVLNHIHNGSTTVGSTGNYSGIVGTVDTSSGGTGGTPTVTALNGQPTGNPTANGVAAQVHSVGQASAHTDHAAASHSAHSGGSVDAHTVGQASAHSDHASQAHSGASVDTVNS